MAGITLAQAQEQLDAALANLSRVRSAQESQVASPTGGHKTIRPVLQMALDEVKMWDEKVKALSRGGITTVRVVPCG